MKILFFAYTFKDYGLDVLFDGLCCVLGSENVFDYPNKDFLHGEIRHRFAMYPCSFDYSITRTDPEKIEMLRNGEFDAVFVGCRSERELRGVMGEYQDIVRVLNENNKGTPVFIIDQGDSSEINSRAISDLDAKLYFKRECLKNENHNPKVIPLVFSYSEKYVPANIDTERTNTLFWAGREYRRHSYRMPYLKLLENEKGEKFRGDWKQHEYSQQLLSHKIGLNLRGYGYDTVRYWEIPAHGTLLFSERLNIQIGNDFVDGETAVFFSSPEEMMEKLDYCLKNEGYVDKIRIAGFEHFKKYHTSKIRAEQIIGHIKNAMN